MQVSKRLRWVTYSVDKKRRTGYKTVDEGKGRSRGWRALVVCGSFSGVPLEAGSEAQGLEQREGKVRKPHTRLDIEAED